MQTSTIDKNICDNNVISDQLLDVFSNDMGQRQ